MAYLAAINWGVAGIFTAMILVIAMFGLSLSGHFPLKNQKPELQDRLGRLVLIGSILVVALAAAKAMGMAIGTLPGPIAILCAGAALLAAPIVLKLFSDAFVDGRRGLIGLAVIASMLSILANKLFNV